MINGIINVYKEPGFTSHDVVAKLRGITHQKKIGHTGTLDPDAVGVLCVCLGAATHVCDMLTDEFKEYEAVLLLGVTTDTQDISGTVLRKTDVNVTEEQVKEIIMGFVGKQEQIPPMYSALKVGGKKLYELARAGKEVERKPRMINITQITICDIDLPRITMRVTCSKGTYIRTLCNDIGEKLGCGATMEHLIRTRVGRFVVEDALKLSEIEQIVHADKIDSILISPQEMFDGLRCFVLDERGEKMASNGNVLSPLNMCEVDQASDFDAHSLNFGENHIEFGDDEEVRILRRDGFFYGVYRYNKDLGLLKPVKMFLC